MTGPLAAIGPLATLAGELVRLAKPEPEVRLACMSKREREKLADDLAKAAERAVRLRTLSEAKPWLLPLRARARGAEASLLSRLASARGEVPGAP